METEHFFDRRVTADHTVARSERPVLAGPNKLKLGVFGANASGGCGSMTYAENQIQLGHWAEVRELVKKADALGIEALIPIARWKSVLGPGRHWDRLYETFTWAAGLAEATDNIQIFSTCHVPFYHPIQAAKMMATVDHISGGRMGLNIVAGYHPTEHAMFGAPLRDHDERYLVADEWVRILKRLWADEGQEFEFDFEGTYYTLVGAESSPKPVQAPHPVIMSAGTSPAGRQFAFDHADLLFIGVQEVEDAPAITSALRAEANCAGREDLSLWTMTHVICRDTEKEALEYAEYIWEEKGDFDSASTMVQILGGGDVRSFADFRQNHMVRSVLRTGKCHSNCGFSRAGRREVPEPLRSWYRRRDRGDGGLRRRVGPIRQAGPSADAKRWASLRSLSCEATMYAEVIHRDNRFDGTPSQETLRVNRLARAVLRLGVKEGDRVAVVTCDRLDQVVAIEALALIGAHAVLIDCTCPIERFVGLYKGSGAVGLLACEHGASLWIRGSIKGKALGNGPGVAWWKLAELRESSLPLPLGDVPSTVSGIACGPSI